MHPVGGTTTIIGALLLGVWCTPAAAQPRRSELAVDVPFAGVARRDLGYVETREALRPGFGASVRVLGRVLRLERVELHVGARLAATAWRTASLRRTEQAFRTTLDPGVVLRAARGTLGLSVTCGPTFSLPAIAELFSGVRTGRGMHFELAFGSSWATGRLRSGFELVFTHHRLLSSTPEALTTTHLFSLRFTIGVAPPT